MDVWQIFALYFGPALAILGLGLRRAIGTLRMLALVAASVLLGGYAIGVEFLARRAGGDLPWPIAGRGGEVRVLLPFLAAAALLGSFGVLLVRFRARPQR